ncbi:MAG: hypothetical protein J5653_05200 [Clostridiales bacterium]|nr:hypothetical protein [Clostridiales bacterium]
MRKALLIIECIILAFGVFMSFTGTFGAVKVSSKFAPYFLFTLLGIAFLIILYKCWEKEFAAALGFVMVILYLIFAGYGYLACSLESRKIKKERQPARQSTTETQYESIEQSAE